jgi:SAM-dependent methyltransferase
MATEPEATNSILQDLPDYGFHDPEPLWGSQYLWPVVRSIVSAQSFPSRRAFDLGCGNGSTTNMLSELGFEVAGVDPSESGIKIARQAYARYEFVKASGYEDLVKRFGRFGLVMSLEVLQHCAYPRRIAQTIFDLLEPGGMVLLSVTYHGYLKNLALAVTGHLDQHVDALDDSGPLRFFSKRTLETLLKNAGFSRIEFRRVGRVPILAKSIIAIGRKEAHK